MIWTQLIAENRIQEAMENGEFENLPGRGRPLDLTDYFNTPVADRMIFSLLKSAGVLPPELQLLKEAEELQQSVQRISDPRKRAELLEQAQAKRVSVALLLDRRRTSIRTDSGLEPGM
ncbi:MAG: DUF1992 domain-containing protein [Verrucomicrobia bacterium]|nr:DUF1992 domain-containing protein [Verrucomicrobiota bacterium]